MKLADLVGRTVIVRGFNVDTVTLEDVEYGMGPGLPKLFCIVADDVDGRMGSLTAYELKPSELK